MTTVARRMTADDLLHMPDDGFRYELVRGELRKMSPPGIDHSRYVGKIYLRFANYVTAEGLGEALPGDPGFKLADDHVRGPDIAFVRPGRLNPIGSQPGYYGGHPDLAIEVISPSDRLAEVQEKVEDYLEAGVQVVVVVNPRNKTVAIHRSAVEVMTLTEADTLEVPNLIPGWQLPVADIFN